MFSPEWIWCLLLALYGSAWSLNISKYDGKTIICSQGLSDCTIKNVLFQANSTVDIQKLQPDFKLCCEKETLCTLCLDIEMELYIPLDKDLEDEDQSGGDEDDKETMNEKTSVTVCYAVAMSLSACKKVEFTVNYTALAQHNLAKVSMVITESDGVSFGSQIFILTNPVQILQAPSLDQVCSQDRWKHLTECQVPTINIILNEQTNRMELHFEGENRTLPSLCVQYELEGCCRKLDQISIPLDSVASCICLQAWYDPSLRRTLQCPFKGKEPPRYLQENMRKNVSVNVSLSKMSDGNTMLVWNLSAPCRLEGEVQLFYKRQCNEIKNMQQLSNGTWKQNIKGLWEREGAFENINERFSQCVMVKINEMKFGPFCANDSGRWRWSLLVVGVMLLVCLTVLMIYFLHDFVKKWVWSWHHGGFVKIGIKGHVVLLSPPDEDVDVSESVNQLGSLLCSQGFSVSVDQWSRKDQCSQGPLLWLYSQLQKLDNMGGRVVLVLTQKTCERTEEWTQLNRDGEVENPQQLKSPYSDLFSASLFLIHEHKQLGRAAEIFVLVNFDSNQQHRSNKSLPELLRGLPLFHLPSQTRSLLAELTVAETKMSPSRRTRIGWR
ncbi:interleukin-17 receptor C [Kryptolebias marmoratus]|uniref:Interleukin-17 receptor C-like n=1 Tax=Kryptolebias marmoratus TaxID=37003 RepID=A0A3Q3EMM2_KRYMA|nr:interleukin-17 receptor C [Kryptolebias marmoratus]